MKEKNIENVMQVWASENTIDAPNKKVQLEIIEQIASMFAAGPFYYYVFNFEAMEMDFVSNGTRQVLGIEPKEFSIQTLFDIMHPDCLVKMHEKEAVAAEFLFNKIPKEFILSYKVSYLMRLKDANDSYRTILHQSSAINVSEDGKIQQVLTVNTDVTYLNIPFNHKVSFIGNKKTSYYVIETNGKYQISDKHCKDNFTKRELEIIKKLAKGKTYKEIAEQLFVSPHTINTHKKNILRKAKCKSTTQLIAKCLSEGVI